MYAAILTIILILNLFPMFKFSKTIFFKVIASILTGVMIQAVLSNTFPLDDSIKLFSGIIALPLCVWIFSFLFQWFFKYLGWYYKPENVNKRKEQQNLELQNKLLREAERTKNLPKCKWCGKKYDDRHSNFCSPKCSKEYSLNR